MTTGVTFAGDQRRRGQRLAVDVVGGDRGQRRAELVGQRAHLRLAGGQLVEELLLQVAAVVLRHLVQLVQRLVAQHPRLDQRIGLGPGQQLLELRRRDRRQRPAREADQLAGVAARADGDRRRLHRAEAGGQVLRVRGDDHLAAAHVAEQLHHLGLVAVDGGAGAVVEERGPREHADLSWPVAGVATPIAMSVGLITDGSAQGSAAP